MTKKQYGFGLIGAGAIARSHARAISEIENAELKGVYSRTKSKADKIADQFSAIAYASLEELLQNKEIDIVCICTPSGIHLEPALKCIAAGKHCLIEKPLEITIERCDKIIDAAIEAGVKIGVIFQSRFHEAEQNLKKAVVEGRFGDLVVGDAYIKWYRSPEYYASTKWRGTRQFDGGGALMNQGIHSVDLLQWFMGPIASVQAISTRAKHKNIEVEDTVVAIVQFANGALGTIEASTAVFPGSQRRVEVRGTEGSAVLEGDGIIEWEFRVGKEEDKQINHPRKAEQSGGASDPSDISFRGHQLQMEDMIQAIETGNLPTVTAEEGRKSVAIIEAIYKSAKSGEMVRVRK